MPCAGALCRSIFRTQARPPLTGIRMGCTPKDDLAEIEMLQVKNAVILER
jgi:hypothetical protein